MIILYLNNVLLVEKTVCSKVDKRKRFLYNIIDLQCVKAHRQ